MIGYHRRKFKRQKNEAVLLEEYKSLLQSQKRNCDRRFAPKGCLFPERNGEGSQRGYDLIHHTGRPK
jgi:hypothetical protein